MFLLLGLAYIPGLFVPLMDNDSAHHANIALHMHLTGDYLSLVDNGRDYLDKPHLLFWLCAFSYKLFGVTTFAYKFPSFLFTILGTYSTFRLGKNLYNAEVGRLASLIVASSFAYILANNDVRMDAILTASVAFASWQLIAFIQNKKYINVAGAALGFALAFSTKGWLGVFIPATGGLFYILYSKEWKLFINPKWALMLTLFAIFILPVIYAYYQQFNLHPQKVVRQQSHINGVAFILWNQNFERLDGTSFGNSGKQDNLFFFHTFLWAFFPWCILGYLALISRAKMIVRKKTEWFTPATILVVMTGLSFAGFKLPHYLNIIFPATAVLVASFILEKIKQQNWVNSIFSIQAAATTILILAMVILNSWAFSIDNAWLLYIILSLALLLVLYINNAGFSKLQKAVLISVGTMAISFFTLNTNFYFQLLKYQAGNELAFKVREKVRPDMVYLYKGVSTQSWNFYTTTSQASFADSLYEPGKKMWLLFDISKKEEIQSKGYQLGQQYNSVDYSITRLKPSFINPETRNKVCTQLILAEIIDKRPGYSAISAISSKQDNSGN